MREAGRGEGGRVGGRGMEGEGGRAWNGCIIWNPRETG